MDIQTLLHNLHEEVTCSVCMCKFTDPKQLPCLHNFCLQCLSRIQRTSGSRATILCPECRLEVRIPGSGDLNALPTNLKSIVCWMFWQSKGTIQAASNVEIATEEASEVHTAFSVVRSGVMIVSVCIMASKPTKNTMHWC